MHLTKGVRMRKTAILFFAIVGGVAGALAQSGDWAADRVHSNVMFTVKHLVISEVTGYFKEFEITVTTTNNDFSDATIDAIVKVGSISTDNERRDGHLKSDDFFNAEKFPEMRFKSRSFKKVAENKYAITGDLTIRDVTKTVTFNATHLGTISSPQMGTRSGWKAIASINRFDYGLKWNKIIETGGLVVGENVDILLNLELVKRPPGG